MDAPDKELSDLLDFSAVCNQNYITYVYIMQYIMWRGLVLKL